ncbi:MAG TPA: carbamate kinase [bacterium]|jgi:carbamate kinase|nr:carbamate kinase [bacterium]HOG37896.1 carbamate kinase [bacterium]HQI03112.1 carbamate kinase [bacterium]
MKKLAVVAFGGNALLRAGEKGTIEEQETNVYQTCEGLLGLIKQDYDIVIGHGNGPQIGNILLQVNAGEKLYGIPEMPMDICGAYSQGFIGYIIEQQLKNLLNKHKLNRNIVSVITQVVVDKNDKAFQNPTKPVGPYYSEEEMQMLKVKNPTHAFAEDPKGKGWRRVVASPQPLEINNTNVIEELARKGHIVITVGGGGIPVFYVTNHTLQGIDAVIDKDLASSLLAVKIKADEFYILTDVPNVFINFRKPDEKALDVITVAEAKSYLQQGQFTEGSMAPKIRAALHFVENGGKECIITEAGQLSNPDCGTRIIA